MNTVKRATSQLAPKRWRAIVIFTDSPAPGEAHLTKDELITAITGAIDMPVGVEYSWGAVEHAAPTAAIEDLKK